MWAILAATSASAGRLRIVRLAPVSVSSYSQASAAKTITTKPTPLLAAANINVLRTIPRTSLSLQGSVRMMGTFRVPKAVNEKHYAPGSPERLKLEEAVREIKSQAPFKIPIVIDGKEIRTESTTNHPIPSSHSQILTQTYSADPHIVSTAITSALSAKDSWSSLPFSARAAVFLKAADLVSGKYRAQLMAATMVGQGKNIWQAEIDAAAELADFLRFNCMYAERLLKQQPEENSVGVWNRLEYRPLEGFVYAISPFNFTAIAGNLTCAPALMGNVVIWKPSPAATLSGYILHQILLEAGLPPSVIQFIPGDAVEITKQVLAHRDFAGLHYTGSTAVFRSLYGQIAQGVAEGRYRDYPRIVGETGGKNFHVVHKTADIRNAALHTIRGAFEYQGQKCSATSRCYVDGSVWDEFKKHLISETGKLVVADQTEKFESFLGPVIHKDAFERLKTAIEEAKSDKEIEIIAGGKFDGENGFYIHPTILKTSNPNHPLLDKELFGPILTIHVYPTTTSLPALTKLIESSGGGYALTGSIFAQDRLVIDELEKGLRYAAGNFYINCKSTGAVVGQQPFGGARASGTNDKAGGEGFLSRWVSLRSVKEEFVGCESVGYASNQV